MAVTALSGGEKSLTLLVLLSAIARVSKPPFRIIDEFDVFQDEQTRKLSIKYLLADAAELGEDGTMTQFVLLTPHDLSAMVSSATKDVRVFRLAKPVRHAGGGGGAGAAGAAGDDDA